MNVQYPLKDLKMRVPFVSFTTAALADDLCDEMIARIEAENPAPAPITIGHGREMMAPDVRNNERVIFDDAELAARLFVRTRGAVPERLEDGVLIGYNERFRGYRYRPGQRFAPHFDGSYFRPSSGIHAEGSQLSVLFYLNSDFSGGETVLMDYELVVQPRRGSMLAFVHAMLHEGRPVRAGTKYVLRTDAMYRFSTASDA
jgi:predicted 2-oxoglutarate/Fe(II)-dependent dioxygenase YbiX